MTKLALITAVAVMSGSPAYAQTWITPPYGGTSMQIPLTPPPVQMPQYEPMQPSYQPAPMPGRLHIPNSSSNMDDYFGRDQFGRPFDNGNDD